MLILTSVNNSILDYSRLSATKTCTTRFDLFSAFVLALSLVVPSFYKTKLCSGTA